MNHNCPHDALFNAVFSTPENAAGELRAVLPPEIAARIDWSTLRLESGHYVDDNLANRYSDLVYSVRLDGREVLVYVLFEHQSTADPLMPFRVLRYEVRIWDRWLDDHKGATTLPAIIPVVLCHAEGGWNKAVSMGELYELPDELRGVLSSHLPEFRMILDDLAQQSDEEIKARSLQALASLGLLLLRHAREDRSMAELLVEWIDLLRAVWQAQGGRNALATIVRYVMLANQYTTIQDLEARVVRLLGTSAREVIMTEGQRLIELGRVEGRDEGRRQGRNEGESKGRAAAVIAVLCARGLDVPDVVRDCITSCTDLAILDRWIASAVTASSAEDVVREG